MAKYELLNQIREMIVSGELKPGQKLTETNLAEKTGVSRTPVRSALPVLVAEGLIEPIGKRGFAVKCFEPDEAIKCLELRSAMEGLAAGYLAQAGANEALLKALDGCLVEGDALFAKRSLKLEDEERYGEMNARFHALIIENCGSTPLIESVERLNVQPLVGTSVVVFDKLGLDKAYEILFRAHGQHHAVVDAIRDRDAFRAEMIFREHGSNQKRSLFPRT